MPVLAGEGGIPAAGGRVILSKRSQSAPRAKQIIPIKGAGGVVLGDSLLWQEAKTKDMGSGQEARGEGLGSRDAVKGSRQAMGDTRLWQAF